MAADGTTKIRQENCVECKHLHVILETMTYAFEYTTGTPSQSCVGPGGKLYIVTVQLEDERGEELR
jgi:hypothetical protein